MKTRVLISGQDPSLPGGMAKYLGGLYAYLETVDAVETACLNETQVKGRVGMTSAGAVSAVFESGRLLREFCRSLRQIKPDVVHLHMAHGLSILEKTAMAALAARENIPAVVHLHGAGLDAALAAMPAWRRGRLDRMLASPHHLIALSEGMAERIQSFLPSVRITVIPNAVELKMPPPLLGSAPVFGFLGFMDGRKGECDLLQALARMDARHRTPPACLLLAGDGPTRLKAEALAARLGLAARVQFLGLVDGVEKDLFFRRINVLCLPSLAENLPISLLEAMGYGRPVIASRVGGIPDLVTSGWEGWLTPPRDIEALASALTEAAENPDEVCRRGQAAWQTVADRFTWERNGPKVVQLYQATHRILEKA